MILESSTFLIGIAIFLEWSHEGFFLLHGLETTMAKLGGGVNELPVNLLQTFGLYQQGLAKSKHSLVSSHHTAFEHDEVICNLTIMHKATQWIDALVRQVIVNRCIVLDQFTILDEVALTNLVNLKNTGVN